MMQEYEELDYLEKESENENTEVFKWNSSNTKFFLNLYLENKKDFRDRNIKKKATWQKLADIMNEHGMNVPDAAFLDKKMRNLKQTYRTIKENNKKSRKRRASVSWEHYDVFEKILEDDANVNIGASISSMADRSANMDFEYVPSTSAAAREDSQAFSRAESTSDESSSAPAAKRQKMSSLNYFRKRQLALEEAKLRTTIEIKDQLRSIANSAERKNELYEKRNMLLQKLLSKKRKDKKY